MDIDGLVAIGQLARNGQLSGPKPVIEVFSGGNLVDTIVGTGKGAQVKARSVTKTVVANTAAQMASAAAAANDAKSVEAAFDYFKKNYANLPAEYKKIYDEAMKDINALNKSGGDYGKMIQIMLGACAKIGEAAKKREEEKKKEGEARRYDENGNQLYDSVRDTAIAAAIAMAEPSFEEGVEYASTIYYYGVEIVNGTENYLYGYTPPRTDNSSTRVKSEDHPQQVGVVHTHPYHGNNIIGEYPSEGDIRHADSAVLVAYVLGPLGNLVEYSPITQQTTVIASGLPTDPYVP